MRAIVITKPGGPEVLELRDVEDPTPGKGEVCVRVRATAVNRADLLQRMGHYPAPADAPADIPGLEFAGDVESIGEGVEDLAIGDRVFGLTGGGSYAEKLVVHARTVVPVPQSMTYRMAAASPEAFITAWDALVDQAGLRAGETVLIHAVGSGVGTAALQIARAMGVRAIGTARTKDKLERAKSFGLDVGIVVENEKFADAVREAGAPDVVLELVGGAYVTEDLACVAAGGRIVLVGLLAGARAELDLGLLLRRRIHLTGTVLRARPLEEKIAATRSFARSIVPMLARGLVHPIVDRILPLEEAAEAHRYMASNEVFGKVVLEVN